VSAMSSAIIAGVAAIERWIAYPAED